MSVFNVPLTVSPDGKSHAPMQTGAELDPQVIPISTDNSNVLQRKETGLLVKPAAMVSEVTPNALVSAPDKKLRVETGQLVAEDEKVISVSDNVLRTNLKLSFNKANNVLRLLGVNDQIVAKVELPEYPGLPVVAEILPGFTPPPPHGAVLNPNPEGTYLHLAFNMADGMLQNLYINVGDLVDVYTGSDTIDVTGNVISVIAAPTLQATSAGLGVNISALPAPDAPNALVVHNGKLRVSPARLIADNSKVLTANAWQLDAELGIAFDAQANALQLTGKDQAVLAQAVLPVYIKHIVGLEVLKDAEPDGRPLGTWLKLDFITSTGAEGTEYYDITPLTDVYSGGKGIDITDAVVTAKLRERGGLSFAEDTGEMQVELGDVISTHTPNALTQHTADNLLWVNAAKLVYGGDKVLSVAGNYVRSNLSMELDPVANELLLKGKNDQVVSRVSLPEHPGLPLDAEILHDFQPPAPANPTSPTYPRGTYMHLIFKKPDGSTSDLYINVSDLVDVYTGKEPIVVGANNEISLRIAASGGLAVAADGLYISLPRLISAEEGNALSTGTDGKLFVAPIDLPDLVSGADSNALRIAKSDSKLYVDMVKPADLVSSASGNGLRVAAADGKLYADKPRGAGNGLQLKTNILSVKPKEAGGIAVDAEGVSVQPTDFLVIGGISGFKQDADGKVYADPGKIYEAGNGIVFGENNDIQFKPAGSGGLEVNETGAFVKLAQNGGLKTSDVGLQVIPSELVSTAPGNGVSVDSYGKLYARLDGTASDVQAGDGLQVVAGKFTLKLDPNSPLRVNAQGQLTIDMTQVAGGVSTDTGNILKNGSDGRPFYPSNLGNV